jgi:serine/threonine protein kinase
VKVLDLGLARFLQDQVADPARTREGAGMGTPDYAAPEQFRDAHAADARADIYALGSTLFHLLTGQVPFPGSSLSEKYEAHAHKAPPPVEELCPDMPGGLALVVQKMLAKRPADRFQSAAEAAEALAPHVAGSSASFQSIRNTSEWEGGWLTLRDWRVRRRRLLPWAVAGVSLIVAVLAVTFGPRWFGTEREREGDQPVVENRGQDRTGDGSHKKEEKPSSAPRPETPPEDPNVLTVSRKEEDGGRYRTINAALEKIKAGQTIRVLDAAVYQESLAFNNPASHKGVTLEAVAGATLETTTATSLI